MKILSVYDFKWMDATYNSIQKSIICNGRVYPETSVLGIIDNEEENYVRCSACGETIHKDMVDKHRSKSDSFETCYECHHLDKRVVERGGNTYTLLDDGLFRVQNLQTVKLHCGRNTPVDITEERARKRCIYAKCKTASYNRLNTFFVEYPDAFNEVLTKKSLDNWEYDKYNNVFYKAAVDSVTNVSYRITPKIDEFDIIFVFEVNVGGRYLDVRYSRKYDKLFYCSRSCYEDAFNVIETRYHTCLSEVMNEIKNLYSQGE